MEEFLNTNTYRRLKVTNNSLRKKVGRLSKLLGLNVIIAVGSVLGLLTLSSMYGAQVYANSQLEKTVAEQKVTIDSQSKDLLLAAVEIDQLSVVAGELDEQNSELVTTLKAQETELEELRERKELYEKYDYAFVREDGSRTDIEYDDIKSLEELAEEQGLGEDAVALVLAISRNESQGYAKVKNPKSSAAGLCGLLNSTAKYSYETLLANGKGSYKSEYVYDTLTNLEMALAYVAYLKDNTSSNYELLVAYRGDDNDASWFRKIQKYTGKAIADLDI